MEIFGREPLAQTEEGQVLHQFTEGLALREAMRPGMLTGMQDILFWQMATGRFTTPVAGQPLGDSYDADPAERRWEPIQAGESGYFSGELGRAYLYTHYESPASQVVLLEATGHTRVFINGMPAEGDHYDYGHTLIPFRLKEGRNEFVYTYGRFGRVRAQIVIPSQSVQFSLRDMTLPSVVRGERDPGWGAVRMVNASEEFLRDLRIECRLETGETAIHEARDIMPLAVRKMPFRIPAPVTPPEADSLRASLSLLDGSGALIHQKEIVLKVKNPLQHHERTFISEIDGSVQYYSLAPSTSREDGQALVLSVHGASVEATNQARAYRQKDWAHIVAPTNRRPFGFNWEEWGRLDALEVLHQARLLLNTDTAQTYLTGHSMGGHGTWFLGATYPDQFAAIAPAAGYPDIIGYRRTGTDSLWQVNPHFEMIYRGALPGRTLDLVGNYQQSGVYVLHGDADAVVSVEQARRMRARLGEFHTNFAYYEYPGGTHWYGDHSMDWPPLFDFLRQNSIPPAGDVEQIDFITASPAVSSRNYWISIDQQQVSYRHSRVQAQRTSDSLVVHTENIARLSLHLEEMDLEAPPVLMIDRQTVTLPPWGTNSSVRGSDALHQPGEGSPNREPGTVHQPGTGSPDGEPDTVQQPGTGSPNREPHTVHQPGTVSPNREPDTVHQPGTVSLALRDGRWTAGPPVPRHEKHPGRHGGFKLAFTNNMLFVYATAGTAEENRWYENKARFDAETFLYRGNGSIDVLPDSLFDPLREADRNVILYGNASNNLAWDKLLEHAPVRVESHGLYFGDLLLEGDDLGCLFIYPRADSDVASVGVVAGTGRTGMRSTYGNDYFSGVTGFPDLLIFEVDWIREGLQGVRISGFFGPDWSIEQGDFIRQ